MNTRAQSESAKGVETAYGIIVMSKDEVKSVQDRIKSALNGIDADIHGNAVQCLIHAEKHGDTSLMRRLLVEIVGRDSGYRRQGLIAWMRTYSPMELKGDTINLSGKDPETGEKRPFKIEAANANPFRSDTRFKEVVPFFQQGLTNKLDAGVKEFKRAIANTGPDGKAIDPSKPFYAGVDTAKVISLVDEIEKIRAQMPEDNTREVVLAARQLREVAGSEEAARDALAS